MFKSIEAENLLQMRSAVLTKTNNNQLQQTTISLENEGPAAKDASEWYLKGIKKA